MKLGLNWNGDRAIGYVVGVAMSLMFANTLTTGNPLAAVGAIIVLAAGVFAPKVRP